VQREVTEDERLPHVDGAIGGTGLGGTVDPGQENARVLLPRSALPFTSAAIAIVHHNVGL